MARWIEIDGGTSPRRAHQFDAGLDVAVRGDHVIAPGESCYLPSGVAFELASSECVLVMPRSSSARSGLIVVPSVIDRGYTGEISTIVMNTTNRPVAVHDGDSLAQAILSTFNRFDNEFSSGSRSPDDRFGSTGVSIKEQ